MDELLLVAGLVLFFALIVAPALAIRAWRKSSDTQRELGVLRERLTALEQQLAGQANAPAPQPLPERTAEPEPVPAPVIVPAPTPPLSIPGRRNRRCLSRSPSPRRRPANPYPMNRKAA